MRISFSWVVKIWRSIVNKLHVRRESVVVQNQTNLTNQTISPIRFDPPNNANALQRMYAQLSEANRDNSFIRDTNIQGTTRRQNSDNTSLSYRDLYNFMENNMSDRNNRIRQMDAELFRALQYSGLAERMAMEREMQREVDEEMQRQIMRASLTQLALLDLTTDQIINSMNPNTPRNSTTHNDNAEISQSLAAEKPKKPAPKEIPLKTIHGYAEENRESKKEEKLDL